MFAKVDGNNTTLPLSKREYYLDSRYIGDFDDDYLGLVENKDYYIKDTIFTFNKSLIGIINKDIKSFYFFNGYESLNLNDENSFSHFYFINNYEMEIRLYSEITEQYYYDYKYKILDKIDLPKK